MTPPAKEHAKACFGLDLHHVFWWHGVAGWFSGADTDFPQEG
jgi:hypothetical protein